MFGGRYQPEPAAQPNSSILDRFRKRKRPVNDVGDEDESMDEGNEGTKNANESANTASESEDPDSSDFSDSSDSSDSSDDDDLSSGDDNDEDVDMAEANEVITAPTSASPVTPANPEDTPETSDSEVDTSDSDSDSEVEMSAKHQAILSKFHKSMAKTARREATTDADIPVEDSEPSQPVEQQPLAPMPQPALPRDKKLSAGKVANNLDWLTKAQYIDPTSTKPFTELGLSKNTLDNLESLGFDSGFSVQVAVLEHFNTKRRRIPRPDSQGDLLVNAATGSGKTLAYCLPIIESLQTRVVPRVRAIILVPTKPLINQVRQTISVLTKGTPLKVMALKSERSIREEGQKLLHNHPDIVVATPGRLVEHLESGALDVSDLRFLIIDEADRLLNQSFQNWASILSAAITTHVNVATTFATACQKMVFSATLTTDAGKLSVLNFERPHLLVVNDTKELVNEMFSIPPTLHEVRVHLGSAKLGVKPLALAQYLLSRNKTEHTLVFCKSNDASLRLAKLLELLISRLATPVVVSYINSTNNKAQQRKQVLDNFSQGKTGILVTTDLFARGIDLSSIQTVVNYDLPNSAREYVHRVGRTARANQSGEAVTFTFGKGELKWFNQLTDSVSRRGTIDVYEVSFTKEQEGVYSECYAELRALVKASK
ncbi:ATP-dependent RNA helicase Dbp6p [Diutina catenulata]